MKCIPVAVVAALALPLAARADDAAELAAIRNEMAALRAAYEARLQSLEQRLRSAEAALASGAPPSTRGASGGAATATASTANATAANATTANATTATATTATTANAAAPTSASTAPQGAPTPPLTTAVASGDAAPGGAAAGAATAFNPAMSLILSGLYTRTSRDPSRYAIAGFALPGDLGIGPGTRGFSLAESELGFAASIDPWLRGAANIAIEPDNTVSIEEAYVQTTSLGNGVSLKAGRFFSGIGYLNAQHSHTWDFVDSPLAYQAMLGSQYGDDGVQLTWLPPLDEFVELGLELGRGRSFPGTDTGRNGPGMVALTAHAGGDIGTSQSWRAGISMLHAKASDQGLVAVDDEGSRFDQSFAGSTRLWIADAVWKWAPNGNATRTNFKLQGEYLQATRSGTLVQGLGSGDVASAIRARQSGWYVQGVYQFMPRWRVGARTERLDASGVDGGIVGWSSEHRPSKDTLMLDFSPSEFSRVRLQLARDRARPGAADTQWFLQYQTSLGAHGAHSY